MTDTHSYHGSCYCGAVNVMVTGAPVMQAYCHCRSCRKWHAAPINAWSSWPEDKVTITGPVIESTKDPLSGRVSCARCGGNVANKKPKLGTVVVYPITLAGSAFQFQPTMHLRYAERVMDVNDGLPKYKDRPENYGGDGEMIAEPATAAWLRT